MRGTILVAFITTLAGCSSEQTTPAPQPAPAPRTAPAPAPEQDQDDGGGGIVIKGSKSRANDDAPKDDPQRRNQEKIEELKRQAAESSASGWTDFASEDGQFKVSLPSQPQALSQEIPMPDGTYRTQHVVMVKEEKPDVRAFFVSWLDVPDTTKTTLDQLMAASAQKAAISLRGRVVEDHSIVVDGIDCHETRIDSANGITIRTRAFVVRSRLYQAVVSAPTSTSQRRDCFRFLESFKITR